MEFNWPRREKYPSYMEVDLQFCGRSDHQIERKHFSRAPWEIEKGLVDYTQELQYGQEEEDNIVKPHTLKDDIRLKSWEKFLDLEAMLPNMRVFKFDTDKQGALKVEFSNMGRYLAVACTMKTSWTIVKIYDVESEHGDLKVVLSGHHDLIHDMHWSANDNYLVTASGDGSAKIWKLHDKDKEVSDNLNYTENDSKFLLSKPLMHPSFVYSAQIHPDASNGSSGNLMVATACFDQKVRLWKCFTEVGLERNQPMCMVELSIMEKPLQTMAAKPSIYEADQLDDEALALIMRPEMKMQYKAAN